MALIQALNEPKSLQDVGPLESLEERVRRLKLSIFALAEGRSAELDLIWHDYPVKPCWPTNGNLLDLYAGLLFALWFIAICGEYCSIIKSLDQEPSDRALRLKNEYIARLKGVWRMSLSVCTIVNNDFDEFLKLTCVYSIEEINDYLALSIEPNYDFEEFARNGILIFWAICCGFNFTAPTFH